MTKIDIISGFLGAGKTTFIKKMLEEGFKGEQIVLIENESGEVGIDGGFLKDGKMLALVMAQAGLGKSVFMSNLAVNFLKQNLGVVVISLEMSQDVYAQRFDAHISNKNINKLSENSESAISSIKAFYKKYPKASLYLKEYPPRSISSRDIEQYLENLRNAGKTFDVVIVDYLNLVLPSIP